MVCTGNFVLNEKNSGFGLYFPDRLGDSYRLCPSNLRQLLNFSNSYRILTTGTDFFRQKTSDFPQNIPMFLPRNRCVLFRYISSPFPDLPIPSPHPPILPPPSDSAGPVERRLQPPITCPNLKRPNFTDTITEF